MLALGTEHARLNKAREDMPLWRRLKDINSFAGRQLSRDLRLTGDSVANLKTTRRSLEEARGFLIGYREQGRPLLLPLVHVKPNRYQPMPSFRSVILQGFGSGFPYGRSRPRAGGRDCHFARNHAEIPTVSRRSQVSKQRPRSKSSPASARLAFRSIRASQIVVVSISSAIPPIIPFL